MKFEDLNISEKIKKALYNLQYIDMTEIQEKSIAHILDGKDLIGQSKTGTGKTGAFSIPIINNIDVNENSLQALILCPTRELSMQVYDEIVKYTKFIPNLKSLCIYGGQAIEKQIIPLRRGVHICVSTPGRIIDHIRRKTIKLGNIKMIVLDEADEMLKMGFEEDIDSIFRSLPEKKQTLLFSATMTDKVKKVSKKYLNNPIDIIIKSEELTANKITQYAVETKTKMKNEAVMRFLDLYNPDKAVVFCNTKKMVDEVFESLNKNGYTCQAIHSDIRQEQRTIVMKRFKEGKINVLIATDVAARGLDIPNLDLVINYDIPKEDENYVHRIGRTGRNGAEGFAITFVVGKEKTRLDFIQDFTKSKIEYIKVPTLSDVQNIRNDEVLINIKEMIEKQNYADLSLYDKIMKDNNHNYKEVSKALYSMLFNTISTNLEQKDDSKLITLFISCGKRDTVKAKDIVGAIANNTALSGTDIGKIDVMDKFTFVEVPSKYVDEVIFKLNGSKIKNKKVEIQISDKSK